MTGTILVSRVVYLASSSLDDMKPQFSKFPQRDMVEWLNIGQRAIAKYLPQSCTRTDVVRLVTGAKQSIAVIPPERILPGDGSAASEVRGNMLQAVHTNMGPDGLTPGASLSLVDRDALDACSPGWRALSKSGKKPVEYTFDIRSPQTFFVNPGVPSGDVVWVELSMICDPKAIPNTGAEDYSAAGFSAERLSIDDKFTDDLHHYILARARLQYSDEPGSAALAGADATIFMNSLNAQALAMTGTNPNLTLLPMGAQIANGRA